MCVYLQRMAILCRFTLPDVSFYLKSHQARSPLTLKSKSDVQFLKLIYNFNCHCHYTKEVDLQITNFSEAFTRCSDKANNKTNNK